MASSDVESFYRKIRNEENGEKVRDAIIDAAKNIYKITSNSGSLGGIPASGYARVGDYMVLKEKIDKALMFDSLEDIESDDLITTSENLMTSGNLYMYLQTKLRPKLANIMNYEIDPLAGYETKAAIAEYIKRFTVAKEALTDALLAKGRKVPNEACFRDYGDIIRSITDGDPHLETDKEFTENKKYDAGELHTDPWAYESFKVNVKNLTVDGGTLTENHKTYTPPEGKLFSKVNISIAGGAGGSGGYGRSGRSTGTGKELEDNGLLKTKTFTENGEFDAYTEDAVQGWVDLEVHVVLPELDAGTTFTVTFVQEIEDESGNTTIETLDTVTVAAYDVARYTGETPTHPDDRYEFYGWEPVPSMVVSNMECKAKFQIKEPHEAGEISDSWEMIIANRGGDKYHIGDYKTLHVGEVNGRNYGDLIFMKVARGEDSTTSSWLMKNCINIPSGMNTSGFWPESQLRTFLNGQFMEDLSMITEGKLIAQNAVPVRKKTMTYYPAFIADNQYSPIIETETFDTIWIPSVREMIGEYPYDIFEKGLKLYYDGIKPDIDPTVDVYKMQNSINRGSAPTLGPSVYHIFESSGVDYTEAHGGVTKTYTTGTNACDLVVTFNDPSKYKKPTGTGSDDPSYFLRSFSTWSYRGSTASETVPNWFNINSSGLSYNGLGASKIALGFCL